MDDYETQLNTIELTEDTKTQLRIEQARLVKIITAFDGLEKVKDWQTLKEDLFVPSINAIERQMRAEVLNKDVTLEKIHRLQGEWAFARQYTNVPEFVSTLKKQLSAIKTKLK